MDRNIIIWERGRAALPYLLLFTGIFLTLSLGSFTIAENGVQSNLFGRTGHYLSWGILYLFGNAAFVPGIMLILTGGILLAQPNQDATTKLLTIPLFLLAVSVSLNVFGNPSTIPFAANGGVLGQALAVALEYILGTTGRLLIHFVIYFYGILVYLNESPIHFLGRIMAQGGFSLSDWKRQWMAGYRQPSGREEGESYTRLFPEVPPSPIAENITKLMKAWKKPNSEFSEPEVPPWFKRETVSPNGSSLYSFSRSSETAERKNANSTPQREATASVSAYDSKIRYKNSGLLDGFFEEDRKVFQFRSASPDLLEKVYGSPVKDESRERGRWELLDLRTNVPVEAEDREIDTIEPVKAVESIRATMTVPSDIPESPEFTQSEAEWGEDEDLSEEHILEDDGDPDFGEESESDPTASELSSAATSAMVTPAVVQEKIFHPEVAVSKPKQAELPFTPVSMVPIFRSKRSVYHIPLNRLHTNPTKVHEALFKVESEKVAFEIVNALKVYGYETKVVAWERGPIITRYELTPPPGVKLGRITSLTDELRMYLAVKNVRIVAPIPGKSTIGIEVPNKHREDVLLGDILRSSLAPKAKKDLNIIIGKDISGKLVSIDLNKLPHLLVAGTTGSGKSVCLNSMIASLVLNLSPEEVRFIMVDPKMVELTLFEDIPHLLMPVIKDARKATKALAWVIQEMESRYEAVSQLKCRDFRSYNEKVEDYYHKEGYSKMPYIVVFIDELADLMMVSGKDLEDAITRISQKSRAVGIHLVMATQRPSVDVITGLIKANCPARIAFHVAQKTDSKIILDMNGAESLLGKGDMLYKSPTSADLARIQAPYISEEEIEKIVEEAKRYGAPTYVELDFEEETETDSADEMDEELFGKAWDIVRIERKASASYLQRKLKIGYNRAARIMELMEERGYVTPILGSKGREILR